MTLQWIALDALEPHPENSNRMAPGLLEKLKGHIRRTGRYEPLVVRPLPAPAREAVTSPRREAGVDAGARPGAPVDPRLAPGASQGNGTPAEGRYQILNGHHRAEVLRELGHTHARCDVWEVDDKEARVLLATLNRLEGRDDPAARARLVSGLAEGRSADDLARLLPEPADALERLLALAKPPPAPLAPQDVPAPARPLIFFLTDEQHALVGEALRLAGRPAADEAPAPANPQSASAKATADRSEIRPGGAFHNPRPSRADAIERLALWYLEARGLR